MNIYSKYITEIIDLMIIYHDVTQNLLHFVSIPNYLGLSGNL